MSNPAKVISTQWRQAFPFSEQCGDCDCACAAVAVPSEPLSAVWQPERPYVLRQPSWATPLAPDYTAMWGTDMPLVVLHSDALSVAERFRRPADPNAIGNDLVTAAQLVTSGVIVPWAETAATPEFGDSSLLSAWLHVTDRCNLRCSYCYLPHTPADMTPATGRAAVDAAFRSAMAHSFRAVKLKYAGGEPLLRFPFILDLHRYAHQVAEQHDLDLDGVVLSNGTLLTGQVVEQLQSGGLRLMISLDGIGHMHDCQRAYSDGQGSFDAVARAIDLALQGGLVPSISTTISGRNAVGLPEVVHWVLERDLPFTLNFYRESERTATQSDLRLEDDQIIEGMLAAYRAIEAELPRRSLLASLVDRCNLAVPHARTCSAGHSYLVFDTQGGIAKCQMCLDQPVSSILDPDPLTTIRNAEAGIRNLPVDAKQSCRDCRWRYWCGGGCPIQIHRTTGRCDAKSPYCAIYQALLPEVIRLEGLRLLRYAGESVTA